MYVIVSTSPSTAAVDKKFKSRPASGPKNIQKRATVAKQKTNYYGKHANDSGQSHEKPLAFAIGARTFNHELGHKRHVNQSHFLHAHRAITGHASSAPNTRLLTADSNFGNT